MADGITSQRLQASNIPDDFYAKSVILREELSSAEMETAVSNNYGKPQSAFDNIQNMLKNLSTTTKSADKPKLH